MSPFGTADSDLDPKVKGQPAVTMATAGGLRWRPLGVAREQTLIG